jgi:hypothetical protein
MTQVAERPGPHPNTPRVDITDLGQGAYHVIRVALARLARDPEAAPGYRQIAEGLLPELHDITGSST